MNCTVRFGNLFPQSAPSIPALGPVSCCQGKQGELSENWLPNLTIQFILLPSMTQVTMVLFASGIDARLRENTSPIIRNSTMYCDTTKARAFLPCNPLFPFVTTYSACKIALSLARSLVRITARVFDRVKEGNGGVRSKDWSESGVIKDQLISSHYKYLFWTNCVRVLHT